MLGRAVRQAYLRGAALRRRRVGSRDFNGSTDRLDWASPWTPAAGQPMSVSLWVKLDRINTYQILWHVLSNTAGQSSCYIANPGNSAAGSGGFFFNASTGNVLWRQVNSLLTTGAWTHLLVTWDGSVNYTGIRIYKNGAEATYTQNQNGGTLRVATGLWSLGAWDVNDLYNTDGKIAQAAVWNRVLTPTEITALASRRSPRLVQPSGLMFYWRGSTAALMATPGGAGTADGTAQVLDGPVIYG